MKTTTIPRPEPTFLSSYGQPAFNPQDLARYRKANGVTQYELADRLGVAQPLISTREKVGRIPYVAERTGRATIKAIDSVARQKARWAKQGEETNYLARKARIKEAIGG